MSKKNKTSFNVTKESLEKASISLQKDVALSSASIAREILLTHFNSAVRESTEASPIGNRSQWISKSRYSVYRRSRVTLRARVHDTDDPFTSGTYEAHIREGNIPQKGRARHSTTFDRDSHPEKFQSQDFNFPGDSKGPDIQFLENKNVLGPGGIRPNVEAERRFGKNYGYVESEEISHHVYKPGSSSDSYPVFVSKKSEAPWFKENFKIVTENRDFLGFAIGGSRSGYGARDAHKIKNSLKKEFSGKISNIKELGKELSSLIHKTAKHQRDALLDNLSNGSSDPEFNDFVVWPPDLTLDNMRRPGSSGGDGADKSVRRHPFSRKDPWGLQELKGTYRKQKSGGRGLSFRGASIWDQLEGVDDDNKKRYSIRWTNYVAAYIYHHFLVAGTSKMVPRKSILQAMGDGIKERYIRIVEHNIRELFNSEKYKRKERT